jgi:hypothetical protein
VESVSYIKNTSGVASAILTDSTGAAITTGATTVFIAGDLADFAATATPTATHRGGGRWTVALTAGERNVDQFTLRWDNASLRASIYSFDEASNVQIADGTITEDTFDGDTAFPLTADVVPCTEEEVSVIVETYINALGTGIMGADGDTLETLSDQLDAIPTVEGVADEVWNAAARTLTGDVPASAATALLCDEDTYATVQEDGTRAFYKIMTGWDGVALTNATVTSITYSVTRLAERSTDIDDGTPVTGHQDVAVTVADVLFDTLQTDAACASYNFRHIVPISAYLAFATAGRSYMVVYTITPTVGEVRLARFRVLCK